MQIKGYPIDFEQKTLILRFLIKFSRTLYFVRRIHVLMKNFIPK